ncbi:hypothetical protein EJ04DRAFT_263770 [Polyplosphaeria fusca]|uniref:Uncharacterized protein n=1 Tax=Polyplosphaeria fusca TaxID=682080 RepID=A0A9P4RAQ7_9PLEO|nr:hypothetical protein EJ04DRAFT_263770 [Polyplosphaeria fusca]
MLQNDRVQLRLNKSRSEQTKRGLPAARVMGAKHSFPTLNRACLRPQPTGLSNRLEAAQSCVDRLSLWSSPISDGWSFFSNCPHCSRRHAETDRPTARTSSAITYPRSCHECSIGAALQGKYMDDDSWLHDDAGSCSLLCRFSLQTRTFELSLLPDILRSRSFSSQAGISEFAQ